MDFYNFRFVGGSAVLRIDPMSAVAFKKMQKQSSESQPKASVKKETYRHYQTSNKRRATVE